MYKINFCFFLILIATFYVLVLFRYSLLSSYLLISFISTSNIFLPPSIFHWLILVSYHIILFHHWLFDLQSLNALPLIQLSKPPFMLFLSTLLLLSVTSSLFFFLSFRFKVSRLYSIRQLVEFALKFWLFMNHKIICCEYWVHQLAQWVFKFRICNET